MTDHTNLKHGYALRFIYNNQTRHTEYYGGGTYTYRKEKYAKLCSGAEIKRFSSVKRAENAYAKLYENCVNVPREYEIVEFPEGKCNGKVVKSVSTNGAGDRIEISASQTETSVSDFVFAPAADREPAKKLETKPQYIMDCSYEQDCDFVKSKIGEKEIGRLCSYDKSEYAADFLGFLPVYKSVTAFVPKDKIIIDLGSNQAAQGIYFWNYNSYITVDNSVPAEWRLRVINGIHFENTIQEFIQDVLPALEVDLNEVFAVCSYVPDSEARELVRKTFPNCLVYYP